MEDNELKGLLNETDEMKQAREIDDLADDLRKQRLNWEKRWLLADRFAAGNHFETWRPSTNEIGKVVFPKGMNVRPIHSAVRSTEGTLNNLISASPQWKVFPHGVVQVSEEERISKTNHARRVGHYLSNLWDDEGLRGKTAEMAWNGLKYCFGVLECYWENGKPKVRSIEPFDILFDPTVKDIRHSSVIIKEVSVPLEKVKLNEKYNENKNALKADGKLSGSSFKESRLVERHGRLAGKEKVLIREAWMENPNGGWDIKHVSQGKILYSGYYEWTRPPFASWKMNPEPLLQTSWFERLIPLNRGIDIILAQIERWTGVASVGRLLRKKGVNIERIFGEHGEIIDVDGMLDSIQWLNTPEIGSTPFNLLAELKNLIAETGASTASVGRIPRGARAGHKLVESLKASEVGSIQHGVRALEDTLEATAEIILMLINTFGEVPIEVSRENEIFEIVGKDFGKVYNQSVPVSDLDFGVNVEISSGLGFTGEARQERAIELAKMGLIDTRTALQILQVGGDVEEIATRALEEYERKEKAKAHAEQAQAQPSQLSSVLDAADFQGLSPETQEMVLEELKGGIE